MSRHTKASRRAALRAYCVLRVIDCDAVDDTGLSDDCVCRFRGGCGGLGVIECRGCGAAFVRCPKTQGLCTAWRWRSRTPVWRVTGEPVHGGTRPSDPFAPPAPRGAR